MIDAKNTETLLEFTENAVFVFKGSTLEKTLEKDDPAFNEKLQNALDIIKEPVVLTEAEIKAETALKSEIIKTRLPVETPSIAKQNLDAKQSINRKLFEETFSMENKYEIPEGKEVDKKTLECINELKEYTTEKVKVNRDLIDIITNDKPSKRIETIETTKTKENVKVSKVNL